MMTVFWRLMIMIEKTDKRRLNFVSGEDFYFLAYSILLVLYWLGGGNKGVRDHRKIAVLIQFLSDERLLSILDRTGAQPVANPVDRELLFYSYTKAELHKREIFKIIFSLEKRGFLILERTDVAEVLDVRLAKDDLLEIFLKNERFEGERINAERLKKLVPRISTLTFETLLEKIYRNRGVQVWAT